MPELKPHMVQELHHARMGVKDKPNPSCLTHCCSPEPLSHGFVLIKKKLYLITMNQFFTCRVVIFILLELNIQARQDKPEFLTAKHVIAVDIDWS